MAPRFSVLLPTRNRSGLLRHAISSVLWQTETDFELLVVGDGCTDNSAEVVAGFNDPRIRWFDLPKAYGVGYANRNIALKQATGEFVAIVTDDDLVFPDHLALLAATLEKSGAEWAYGRPLWVTTDGFVVPFAFNLLNADELSVFLTIRNHIPSTCVMHRRSCLDKYGYWPEDVISAGDWKCWIQMIEGGKGKNLAYCPIPSMLHFHAHWKVEPDAQASQVTAAREIAATGSWWPDSLNVPIPPGKSEQQVFYDLIQQEGYVDELRRDVIRVVERLAWMQLNGMPELQARLESGTVNQSAAALRDERIALKAELAAAQARLDAVHASTSWRVTAPLRAMLDVIQRRAR